MLGIDPHALVATYGLVALTAVIFAETGLLVGVVLPGETMLVLAGAYSNPSGDGRMFTLPAVAAAAAAAAAAGGFLGYAIGRRAGPALFSRPDARLFRRSFARRTEEFFHDRGPAAIVVARFIPIVRTFAAPAAGVGRMPARSFAVFNIVGAAVWGLVVPTLGHAVAEVVPVDRYLLPLTLSIAIASLFPAAIAGLRHRRAVNSTNVR